METSDEQLAVAASGGDGGAFASLLARHYDGIFRLAFRLTGNRADAEDLTQDICAALPAKLSAYRANAKLTTWLYRVVVNASHDRRRRGATHSRAANGWGDWEVDRRASNAATVSQLEWLNYAMTRLPESLRDTLALVLDDMTHTEAAALLNVSEGTISWRISEAKKCLRTLRESEDQT